MRAPAPLDFPGGYGFMHHLYLFMTAMFAALIMVPFLHRWALNTGAVDVPDERKVHRQTTPRIGGIAIFMALLFSTLVYDEMGREVRGILAGGLIIFFTGLIDDLYGLSPRRKFAGEIGATLIAMGVGGLYITNLGNLFGFGAVILPWWLAVPFTLFAVVGVINALNLIDGLDGLAGGVSVIALSTFFLLALIDDNYPVMALCAALLGALLGFLKYNFYPARIFMGDTGSLVVGFLLAFLAIFLTQRPGGGVSPAIPIMILGLPIADTVWVMTRRVLKGGSPFSPDRSHVHHKFLDLGFQHRFTVLILYGISLFWAIFSILFSDLPEYLLLLLFTGISIACYVLLRHFINNREKYAFL
jgi:UDP-GlcNAc:undecaprenyl-phosphate/decaprenyl-phosphate GlcNAc-1-phosphate transferase